MEKRAALATKVDATIQDLIKKIDQNPNAWPAYNDLGVLLTQIGDYNSAEELVMKALGLFDQDATAKQALLYTLGNVYYSAAEYDRAVTYFQKIDDVTLKGDALIMLAQSFFAQQKYQQALVYGLTAHDILTTDITVLTLLGDICLALGEFQQADGYYADALSGDVESQTVAALFGRGLVALALGDEKQAHDYFKQVASQDRQFYDANRTRVDEIATVLQHRPTK